MDGRPIRDRRWTIDTRGTGIGDGAWIAPDLAAALAALAALAGAGWVAEDPDAHLLPLGGARPGTPQTRGTFGASEATTS